MTEPNDRAQQVEQIAKLHGVPLDHLGTVHANTSPGTATVQRNDDGTRTVLHADPVIRVSTELLGSDLNPDVIEPDGTLRLDHRRPLPLPLPARRGRPQPPVRADHVMTGETTGPELVWPANLMREIREVWEQWRQFHNAIVGTESPVLAEIERATRIGKVPEAPSSTPDAVRVARDLVPLVRAAAADVPMASVPAIGLDALHNGSLQDRVNLALVSNYRVEVDRRYGELLGDLTNWQPIGILNTPSATTVEVQQT